MKRTFLMTSRQCEIAAEAYAACILAQCGYDVLVQYGANQPHYDLVAIKKNQFLPVSVKGSQDGGWMLAVRYVKKGVNYIQAIDTWLANQRKDTVFLFVQFLGVGIGELPRSYIAGPSEIATHMKTQCAGRGHGALQENVLKHSPNSKYSHKIPDEWTFSLERLHTFDAVQSHPIETV